MDCTLAHIVFTSCHHNFLTIEPLVFLLEVPRMDKKMLLLVLPEGGSMTKQLHLLEIDLAVVLPWNSLGFVDH